MSELVQTYHNQLLIFLFVLVDGWTLIVGMLMESFAVYT